MQIQWQDEACSLDVSVMDDTHREFVELYNSLMNADDENFARAYSVFVEHTEAHFLNEDKLMEESGFPAIKEHRGEHQRVLNELKYFHEKVNINKFSFPRFFLKERIPSWFSMHLASMDSALAHHLKQTG